MSEPRGQQKPNRTTEPTTSRKPPAPPPASGAASVAELIDRHLAEGYERRLRAIVTWCPFCGETHEGALTAECPNPPKLTRLRGITRPDSLDP